PGATSGKPDALSRRIEHKDSKLIEGMILPKSHFINSISSINSELLSKLKESLTNDEHIKKLFPDFSINGVSKSNKNYKSIDLIVYKNNKIYVPEDRKLDIQENLLSALEQLATLSLSLGKELFIKEIQQALKEDFNITISCQSLQRNLKEAGLKAGKRKCKPILSKANIKKQLQFLELAKIGQSTTGKRYCGHMKHFLQGIREMGPNGRGIKVILFFKVKILI
ncbi:hypothetical protein BB558_006813, partial [Smittium angustum]